MRKTKRKLTKRSLRASSSKKKSMGSKPLALGLEKAFSTTLSSLHNTANKKGVEFSKQVKQLKSKLKKTLNKKGKILLQQKIKIAEQAHLASKLTLQKLAALKTTLQKFEKEWSKKAAKAQKQAAAKAAKAKARGAATKRKKTRSPTKSTTTASKPFEGFGSTSYGSSPAPFGQSHSISNPMGGQPQHY